MRKKSAQKFDDIRSKGQMRKKDKIIQVPEYFMREICEVI
jgi:hypothetical protein